MVYSMHVVCANISIHLALGIEKKKKTDTDRPDGCVMIRGQSFKCNIKSWSRLDEPWRDGAFVHCSVS